MLSFISIDYEVYCVKMQKELMDMCIKRALCACFLILVQIIRQILYLTPQVELTILKYTVNIVKLIYYSIFMYNYYFRPES